MMGHLSRPGHRPMCPCSECDGRSASPLPEGRAGGRDRILADALIYYAERRPMNNPKGWDHVLRVVEDAIAKGVYGDGPHDEARTSRGDAR
jgi:hypothetical protein